MPRETQNGGLFLKHRAVTLQGKAREEWSRWLSSAPWDLFVTLTDPGMSHPEHMTKRSRYLEALMNRALYGNHHERRGQGIETVTGLERQKRGSVHSHMLVRFPDHDIRDPDQISLRYWQRKAADLGGHSYLTVPKSQNDVVDYVTKYVVKEGELVLGPMFDPNRPRSLAATLLGGLHA